ncbi:MAG: pseudouridine synthase [Planctomycetota bacterium]|nr:MAG: pseudouridine synthase [Planctomycetota bacterium]
MQASTEPIAGAAPVLNLAAYKFTRLAELDRLRAAIRERCVELGLRGTVLVSHEGINLFVAGQEDAVRGLLDYLRTIRGLEDLEGKFSRSATVPFRRMLVRIKKEIIPLGIPTIRPAERTSPKLPPRQLQRWLEEGRKVRLLDVRNEYEVELGTFEGAEHLGIHHFREFVQAIDRLPPEAKDEPVVMFCTGGIRCEKAGPLLEQAGFRHVYQLEGGILKYFEECGGAHYRGNCFVFDGRVALDPHLQPTGHMLCFACQSVVTAEDVASGKFMFGKYCPRCYQDPSQKRESERESHRRRVRELAASQPGCTPYDHVRPIYVPRGFAGQRLIDFLTQRFPGTPREQWVASIEAGLLTHNKFGPTPFRVCQPGEVVREGQGFLHHMPDTTEPPINPDIDLIYEDDWLVAVAKPAPLPVHPCGRFQRNSLTWLLQQVYSGEVLHLVHRLDANTTGVVLLARRHRAAKLLAQQFADQAVEKTYFALLDGHPQWEATDFTAPISDHAQGEAGGRDTDPRGQPATTRFEVVRRLAGGQTLVRARPYSGRTNQIRVHAWAMGIPVVGDPMYRPGRQRGGRQTLAGDDPPMCLHAAKLAFRHPLDDRPLSLCSPAPPWLKTILEDTAEGSEPDTGDPSVGVGC